jgi:hypothetical protein
VENESLEVKSVKSNSRTTSSDSEEDDIVELEMAERKRKQTLVKKLEIIRRRNTLIEEKSLEYYS